LGDDGLKKFLAVLVAVVMVGSSAVTAFAVDKSSFNFKPVSEFDFLADVLPQFDQGNGNYLFPVDFNGSPSLGYTQFIERFNNPQSYYSFFHFVVDTGGNLRFYLDIFPKSNFRFATRSISRVTYYSFIYSTYSNNILGELQLQYEPDRNVFRLVSGGFHNNYMNFACEGNCSWATGFLQDSLFSYLSADCASGLSSFSFVSGVSSFSFVDYNEYVPPAPTTHTLTINYLYSENNPAADSVAQEVVPGEEYSIPSPEIAGYTPSIPVVSGTMPEEDLIIDIYYSKSFYNLTVKYQYADGTKAAEDTLLQYPSGFVYDVPIPQIDGYQPDKSSVAGTMPENPVTEIVTYTAIPYTLIVNYQYADGSQAAESHQEQLTVGTHYSVPSPTIEGFHPNQTSVTGIMPAADVTSTVTYRKDSGGSGGTGPAGPGEGGESGGETGGGSGGGGDSGDDPFTPVLPPFSGNDPFIVPDVPEYSGYDPFTVPKIPGYSGYDPFIVPKIPAFSGYDPFSKPDNWGES